MYRLTLSAALMLTPTLGLACPVSADLSNGITLSFDDDTVETYRALRDDLVRLERSYLGDTEAVMDLALGIYVLSYMDVYDGTADIGTRVTTSYPGGIASLPLPVGGQRWEAQTVVTDGDGPYVETVSVAWSEPGTASIGACSYPAIEGIIAYIGEGYDPYFEGITYLPDLGLGFVSWFEDNEGRESYTALSIAAR